MSPKKLLRSRSLSATTTKICKTNRISFVTPLKASEKFTCSTCLRAFTSQLMFSKHKKEKSCVEPVQPVRKKTTTTSKSTQKEKKIELMCDECGAPFTSYRILSQHKNTSHSNQQNLPTNVDLKKKKIIQKFAGIPANAKLKNAFAAVKAQTNSL